MEDRLLFARDDLGDGFLSDMDDDVDMEEIREGMKLVPLPDMDRDAAFSSFDDILRLQGADDPYKSNEEDHSHSGEAAKKAAKVAAPHVLTGGVVAESGPPPDFSLWTVEDDLLLRNAMEAGAAMEALARGAMRFSRRYTVRELRERWRALLYDSEVSSKAAIRMVEAEAAFLESMRLMFPNKQKLQDFVHKHRQKSVRDTFYKTKRGLIDKTTLDGIADGGSEIDFGDHGFNLWIDPDDHAFSQMVDLLATGGIGAVIGAFPPEAEFDALQDAKDEVSLESSMSPVMVTATEKENESLEPNGAAEEYVTGDEPHKLEGKNEVQSAPATPVASLPPSSSNILADNPEPYVILSSDEDEDYRFQKPKRPRTDVVQEKFVCSFNTHETELSTFGLMSSPSSEDVPGSPEDVRCGTSDVRSSDCVERAEDETAETSGRPLGEVKLFPANVKLEPGIDPTRQEVDPSTAKPEPCTDKDVEEAAVFQDNPPEVESDNEVARFSDVESMILDMDLDPGDNELSAKAESKRFYRQHQMTILRLEQSVNSAMQRYLSRKGAIAILYGYHLKYLMVANEVSIGRRTQGNVVDVDLAQEGPANKVSRKQASIKLNQDGVFLLKNLGKKVLYVNDILVFSGQRAVLSSSCLIEVGGMRLVFEANRKLTHQRIKEMTLQESS